MKACVKWTEARRFIGGSGFDHRVIIDASAKLKGKTTFGSSPMEMLLPGICGRTVSRIIAILNKMRPLVEDVVFELKAVRTDSPQRYSPKFTHSSRSPATYHWKKRKKRCPPISPSA